MRRRSRKLPDRVSPTKAKPFPTPKESANRARGRVIVAQDAVCEKIQSSRGGAGCRSRRVYARSRRCVTDDRSHPRMLLRPRRVPDGSGCRFERHRSSGLHRGAYPERGRFTACKPGVDAAGDAALTAASMRAGVLVDLWRLRRRHDVVQRRRTRMYPWCVFKKSRCQTNNAPCVISAVRARSAVPGAKALSPPQIDRRGHLRRRPSRSSCPPSSPRSRSSSRTKAAPSDSHVPRTRVTLPTNRSRVAHPRSTRAWSPSDVRGRDRFDNARCCGSNPDI
jgi:hypothetical protein